jgi:hypothetical protein
VRFRNNTAWFLTALLVRRHGKRWTQHDCDVALDAALIRAAKTD